MKEKESDATVSPKGKKALVLLSGGLDSSTVCALAARDNEELFTLSFDYGQTLRRELEYAEMISLRYGSLKHLVFKIDLTPIGGSALTDTALEIPVNRNEADMKDIPVSYVPARNTIFLSIALAWAEVLDANSIHIGVNAVDYSGYPDCRPEYINAFQRMADRATRRGVEGFPVEIVTPLLHLKKSEIVRIGMKLGVPYQYTWSCYTGEAEPCGRCDSCLLRARAFDELGVSDPALSSYKTS